MATERNKAVDYGNTPNWPGHAMFRAALKLTAVYLYCRDYVGTFTIHFLI